MGQIESKKKPVVMTMCSAGHVGTATIKALTSTYSHNLEIKACVRDVDDEKAHGLEHMGATLVKCIMGDSKSTSHAMKGVNRLFIIAPPSENRVELVKQAADAAKKAGVHHVVMLSVLTADLKDTVYGKQFSQIEEHLSKLGVHYTILRLPMFMENLYSQKRTVIEGHQMFAPCQGDRQFSSISVVDVGVAAAAILADPDRHHGHTYNLVSTPFSNAELCQELSRAMGTEVKYEKLSYEEYGDRLLERGVPEWHVKGIAEIWHHIDHHSMVTRQTAPDFARAAGKNPMTLSEWVDQQAKSWFAARRERQQLRQKEAQAEQQEAAQAAEEMDPAVSTPEHTAGEAAAVPAAQ